MFFYLNIYFNLIKQIIDWGSSAQLSNLPFKDYVGTPVFMAPEILNSDDEARCYN